MAVESTLPTRLLQTRRRAGRLRHHGWLAAVRRARSVASTGSIEGISVANIKSQIKRNRQNEKRRRAQQGRALRAEDPRQGAPCAAEPAARTSPKRCRLASKRIDKAAAKGVIHKNQAARRKSRLMKTVSAAEQSLPSRPLGAPGAGSEPRQAGHQHLHHQFVRPARSRPAGRGRPRPAVVNASRTPSCPSRRACSSAFLAGNVEPFMPEQRRPPPSRRVTPRRRGGACAA